MELIDTPRGAARLELAKPKGKPTCVLALGHGAGGDVDAPDLQAVKAAVLPLGVTVALITQPYRVAGKRAPAPAPALDEAWITVVSGLARGRLPLLVGGRSSGARVACRTAVALGAAGVVALAFPLHPPGKPDRSRAGELLTGVPTLVVNGDKDPFGVPAATPGVDVTVLPGEQHSLRKTPSEAAAAVVAWMKAQGLIR